jgi:hypothetical protein
MNFNKLIYKNHFRYNDIIHQQIRICNINNNLKTNNFFIFRIEYLDNNKFITHEIYPKNKFSKIDLFNKN